METCLKNKTKLNILYGFIDHFISIWKVSFNSFAHLLIELFTLFVINVLGSLYILDINPLPDEWLSKIFLPFRTISLLC
jgi:hypothetical protein